MKPPVLLCLLILTIFSACNVLDSITGPDDEEASLSGRVTMAGSGAPHYPATVALLEDKPDFRYEPVNTEGRYRFRDVRPGHYVIVLTLGQGAGVREALREPIEIVPGANVKDFVVR